VTVAAHDVRLEDADYGTFGCTGTDGLCESSGSVI